jgi:hypothetical protein
VATSPAGCGTVPPLETCTDDVRWPTTRLSKPHLRTRHTVERQAVCQLSRTGHGPGGTAVTAASSCFDAAREETMGPSALLLIVALLNLPSSPAEAARDISAEQASGKRLTGHLPTSWSRLSDRLARRAACKRQATERGLSGRMARRYTRLCLSGLPIPKPIRRSP